MMNRRHILGMAGGTSAALMVGVLPGLMRIGRTTKTTGRSIRLAPVPGITYTAATLAFMERARFESPRQAIYGMKDPNIPFLIQHVSSSSNFPAKDQPAA